MELSTDYTREQSRYGKLVRPMRYDEFADLLASIEGNPKRNPIVTVDEVGDVLEGWNRYLICKQLERPYLVDDEPVEDPVQRVLEDNVYRRHLSQAEKAAIVRLGLEMQGKKPSVDEVARQAGVSRRTQQMVDREVEQGRGEEVARGERTLTDITNDRQSDKTKPRRRRSTTAQVQSLRQENATQSDMLDASNTRIRALEELLELKGEEQTQVVYRELEAVQRQNQVLETRLQSTLNELAECKKKSGELADRIRAMEQTQ